jgi:hypothetical protein
LAACGQQREAGYPPGVEMNFTRACESQNPTQGLCACIWDKIEADVPPNDFAALERLPGPEREAHPLMRQINEYSFACARQLEMEPAPTP